MESQSTAHGVSAGLRLKSALGGLQFSVEQHMDARTNWPFPVGIERLVLLIDSPHANTLRTCQRQSACVSSFGGIAALSQAMHSPSLWLRVEFADSDSARARRATEAALCRLVESLASPEIGFEAASSCLLPATSHTQVSTPSNLPIADAISNSESIWQRHNLTSPSLVLPNSKLASIPRELMDLVWPYVIFFCIHILFVAESNHSKFHSFSRLARFLASCGQ